MRVCPKCGYRDLPVWRNAWHKRFTDVTRIGDLEIFSPELYKKILDSPKFYTDGLYNYKLSKRGYVIRILKEHAISSGSCEEPHRERWRPAPSIHQTKLLEVEQK